MHENLIQLRPEFRSTFPASGFGHLGLAADRGFSSHPIGGSTLNNSTLP